MSAQDNLSHQLFHGTEADLSSGDIVKPNKGFSWASTVPEVAAQYGSKIYTVESLGDAKRVSGADKKFGIHASPTGFRVTGKQQ